MRNQLLGRVERLKRHSASGSCPGLVQARGWKHPPEFSYAEQSLFCQNYLIWQKGLASDAEYIIVLEDDVVLAPDFFERVQEFVGSCTHFDYLVVDPLSWANDWTTNMTDGQQEFDSCPGMYFARKPGNFPWSTSTMQIIRKTYLPTLLKTAEVNGWGAVDNWWQYFLARAGERAYAWKAGIALQASVGRRQVIRSAMSATTCSESVEKTDIGMGTIVDMAKSRSITPPDFECPMAPVEAVAAPAAAAGTEVDQPCFLAFSAHSGFTNQVYSLFNGLLIAEAAGCKILLPPVLNHHDLPYEWPNDADPSTGALGADKCLEGDLHERALMANASKLYSKRHLEFEHMFRLKPSVKFSLMNRSLDSLQWLPLNCSLWLKNRWKMAKFNASLRELLKVEQAAHPESRIWTMGSAFRLFHTDAFAGIEKLGLNRLFTGFSPPVERLARKLANKLMDNAGGGRGRYGCVHLRAGEAEGPPAAKVMQLKAKQLAGVRRWIQDQVLTGKMKSKFVSKRKGAKLPLYVMSVLPRSDINWMLAHVSHYWSSVQTLDDLMPGDLGLGLPAEQRDYERLAADIAVCAQADVVYLPNFPAMAQVGVRGKLCPSPVADAEGELFSSSLSKLVGELHLLVKPNASAGSCQDTL